MSQRGTAAAALSVQGRAVRVPAFLLRPFADWLGLAATPCFAAMAIVTAMESGGPLPLCSATTGSGLLGGMVPMYGLMAIVHLKSWFRLMGTGRPGA